MVIQNELPAFDTAVAGATSRVRPDINLRRLHGFLLQVQGIGPAGAILDARNVIEYIQLLQDGKQKHLITPGSWTEYQYWIDANSDNLPLDFLYVPLSRAGIPDSAWGTGDIGQLELAVKLKAGFGTSTFTRIVGWMSYVPLAKPEPRGPVILNTIVNMPLPVAGWNKVADLSLGSLVSVTRLMFSSSAITQVKASVSDREVYNLTKGAAIAALAFNPMYKMWNSLANSPTFPCFLDVLGTPGDYVPLVEGGVRRPLNIEYFWDTNIFSTTSPFELLVEGVEPGAPKPTVNAA